MSTKKAGVQSRRRAALERLESKLKTFRSEHKDKEPWDTTRKGRIKHHSGRSFEAEVQRMETEIANLKHNIDVNKKP